MGAIKPLPKIMVAPNGARRTKSDHSALPITIEETVEAARDCQQAGATGLHLHVRDNDGKHTLDSGLYLEALSELKQAKLTLDVQITTEAVGQYSPKEQREVVRKVMPEAVSISIAEMLSNGEQKEAEDFYNWCHEASIAVQHILYGVEDARKLESLSLNEKYSPQLLFVLGRYAKDQQSQPDDITPFHQWLIQSQPDADWGICAFGQGETDCLIAAHKLGGKLRIGFENSLWHRDGHLAHDNAERVAEIVDLINS